MIELFHVSDLHFGKSSDHDKRARDLVQSIESNQHVSSDVNKRLLITGDSVIHTEEKYNNSLVDALRVYNKKNIIIIPGNHEYGPPYGLPISIDGFGYNEKCAKSFDQFISDNFGFSHDFFDKEPYHTIITDSADPNNQVMIIALNSCHKKEFFLFKPWGSQGKIGRYQRNKLKIIVNNPAYSAIPKIVLLHHIPNKWSNEIWMHLVDWKKLMKIVRYKVKVLAFGHQGKMDPVKKMQLSKSIKGKKLVTEDTIVQSGREMKIRSNEEGVDYILDANNSVDEYAYYHIKIENNEVKAVPVKA